MALKHTSVRMRAAYGVHHSNVRHTSRYTVIGNHLLQNPELSLTARGLGAYIQSLPPGTPISIKELVKRVPEGEVRIAAALRELEALGYLERGREQLPNGRFVTRTVSYNHPKAAAMARAERPTASQPKPAPEPEPQPAPVAEPEPEPEPIAEPEPEQQPEAAPQPEPAQPEPAPHPQPLPEPEPQPDAAPAPAPEVPSADPPVDDGPSPARKAAMALLAELRRVDHRLLLGQRDIERLSWKAEVWTERGASKEAVIAVLTANIPDSVRNPAGLIAHRLSVQEPPALAPLFRKAAYVPPDPFQSCDTCDRAFRSPTPGTCGPCTGEITVGTAARWSPTPWD